MAQKHSTTSSSTPALRSILAFYDLGIAFQDATGGVRSTGAAKALALENRCSEVTLYKARQFTEMYSQEDLKELCSLKKPDKKPLGIGHVHQLIQVKNRAERKRLQAEAAKHGWSSRKLKQVRQQKLGYGAATNVGRKPRRAEDIDEALLQLAQRADQWKRWVDALSPVADDRAADFDLGELSDTVRDKLKAVTNAVGELAETLQRVMRNRNLQKAVLKKKR